MNLEENKDRDLLVVGGGITGLCIAYMAAKSGQRVMVLEKEKTMGGLLKTFEIGETQLEYFYHHFFLQDEELHWLIKDLGIEDQLRYQHTKMGIYAQGKIYDFSTSSDLLKFNPISFIDKIRFGLTSIYLGKYANWRVNEHISAIEWFEKWAGKRSTQTIWTPLLKVKFGKYFDRIPLAWMIGRLKQRMQSRKSGKEELGYINGSLNVLLKALQKALVDLGVELITEVAIDDFIVEGDSIKGVHTASIDYYAKQVVVTIPSPYVVGLVKKYSPNLSEQLSKIEYFGAVCTILELNQKLSDIYWLNIADEGFPFGGIIEHTNFIPAANYNNKHIVYLSRYFTQNESISKMDPKEIKTIMINKLKEIYPNMKEDWIEQVHVFRTNTAATVCELDFSKKVTEVETRIKGLYIANMAHIYPDERSVNNAIRIAADTCNVMGINIEEVPKGATLAGSLGFKKSKH